MEEAFAEYDTDNNAYLSRDEFKNFMATRAKMNH